jgi:histidine triad (HIT) family protein
MTGKNIFQRIIDREIPADIVFEDERCLAFRDVNPQAPVHLLIIPKRALNGLDHASPADAELLGHLLVITSDLARQQKLQKGYRVVTNCGEWGGQSVPHLHFHLLGGRAMTWPPG